MLTNKHRWVIVIVWAPEMENLSLIATTIIYFIAALLLREKSRLCSRRSTWMSSLVLVVVTMQPYAVLSFAETGTPDSGIFGVVPRFQENLKWVQGNIDSLRQESSLPAVDQKSINATLIQEESLRDKWKNQCVEAYGAQSYVPLGYSSAGDPGMPRSADYGSCIDRQRFPRDYMNLTAAAACSNDGSFRLPLMPGRYVVFVGQDRAVFSVSGGNPWRQLAIVKPHQWQRISAPKDSRIGATCTTDAECVPGYVCISPKNYGGYGFSFPAQTKTCQQPVRAPQPAYNSGVRGRAGLPVTLCYGNPPAGGIPTERQCVEAFREGSADMITCGGCGYSDGGFVLPLPPGRYTLDFQSDQGSPPERRSVEVRVGQWIDLYALGAKSGPIQHKQCPPGL